MITSHKCTAMNTPGAKMLIVTFDRHCSCLAACCCTPETRQEHATVCWGWGRRDSHSSLHEMLREHMWRGGSQGASRAAVTL